MRQALLLLLLLSLTACGRAGTNLYQSHFPAPMLNAEGQAVPDLRTQNRMSLLYGTHRGYAYVDPNQAETASETKTSTETSSNAAATAETEPVAETELAANDPLAVAQAGLAELSDALETLIRARQQED
ncbi:MAG: hypothetical protein IGS03_03395 [Candidatus Sericytochromatia bacterium]|nr:hypothetical protein [Candidatus Sericytochromatia bacterium]